jgi:hypothetical protein
MRHWLLWFQPSGCHTPMPPTALLVNAFLDRLGAGSAVIIGFVGFFATMGMIGITSFINEQVNSFNILIGTCSRSR